MKLKSELYKIEQEDITDKIINILELDKNSILLYNLYNDKIKQNKILELIPDIREYYSFTSSVGASEPDKAKRPYVSIVRRFTKNKFTMISSGFKLKVDNKMIRTKKYAFIEN